MGPKPRVTERDFFCQPLLEQINLKHPLVRLASIECMHMIAKGPMKWASGTYQSPANQFYSL
jgi:hypothetical protein